MITQGQGNSLSDYFQTLEYLLNAVDSTKQTYASMNMEHPCDEYLYLSAAAEASWNHVEKYYKLIDESPAYYAAQILDPHNKWAWLTQEWGGSTTKAPWLAAGKEKVRTLWMEDYKSTTPSMQEQSTELHPEAFSRAREFKRIKLGHTPVTDEYEAYLATDRESPDGRDAAITFWNLRYHSQPALALFALDMLAIPCMADDCERLFSGTGLMITSRRSRLLPDIIEASELLRVWAGKPSVVEGEEGIDAEEVEELPPAKKNRDRVRPLLREGSDDEGTEKG